MDTLSPMHALSGRKIIFMPGLDGTGISFEPLRQVLPHDVDARIVRYPTDRLLSFEETVRYAGDRIHPEEDGIILAESFSGPVAVVLLGAGLIKAKGLILCCTFARSPRPRLWRAAARLPLRHLIRLPLPGRLLKHVIEGGEPAADLFTDMWRRVGSLVPARVLAHRLRVISGVDVRSWLPRVKVPCVYIQATGDRTVPPRSLLDFTEALPHLEVRRIKGPHFLLQARPLESLAVIRDFAAHLVKLPQGDEFTEPGTI